MNELVLINKDERGSFSTLLPGKIWSEANLVESAANCIRGKHFHRKSTELFYVIEGEIKVSISKVSIDEKGNFIREKNITENIYKKDCIFSILPMTWHVFEIQKESKWLALMSFPHDSENLDIIKLD